MISIADIIWGEDDSVDAEFDKELSEIQHMSYTCLEMCCNGQNWYDNPKCAIACR